MGVNPFVPLHNVVKIEVGSAHGHVALMPQEGRFLSVFFNDILKEFHLVVSP